MLKEKEEYLEDVKGAKEILASLKIKDEDIRVIVSDFGEFKDNPAFTEIVRKDGVSEMVPKNVTQAQAYTMHLVRSGIHSRKIVDVYLKLRKYKEDSNE